MKSSQSPGRQVSPGLQSMLLAAFFFSLMSLFVKLVGQRLPSQQIVLVRSLVTLAYSYLALRWAGVRPWGQRRGLLVLRGLVGFVALSCFFFALTRLPLAEATVIQYTNPVFTALLAAAVLHEPLSRRDLLAAGCCLVGVGLIARPAFLFGAAHALDPLAVALALVGAVLSAGAYVLVRHLRRSEHPLVIVFYFPLVSSAGALPMLGMGFVWPTLLEWAILVGGVGLAAQLGQVFLTRGLHAEQAGRAMSMSYVQIVFATLWGLLVFGERPDLVGVAGALLVVGGTALAARTPRPAV